MYKIRAKHIVYLLLGAFILVGILLPTIGAAEAKPMVFTIDPSLTEPKVIYRPYPDEFKKRVPQKIQPLAQKSSVPSHTSIQTGRDYAVEEVQDLIRKYSAQYGISAQAPLCIAKLESGYNQFSKNKNSSASGVFQYLNGTWKVTDEGRAGLSVFNADANAKAAVKYMASRKNAKPWTVASKCPPIKTIN